MISDYKLKKLLELIKFGNEQRFYTWSEWLELRKKVLYLDNRECQFCKAKGKYKKAKIVHHVKHLKVRPDLALSIWDGKERQLVSVCKSCHEDLHPESQRQFRNIRNPVTVERWD